MPRKTRSDKILTKLRRLEDAQNSSGNGASETKKTTDQAIAKLAYNYKTSSQTKINQPATVSSEDYSYVFKDLRKTAAFAIVAIAFQLILRIFVFK